MAGYLLGIDAGQTATKASLFDLEGHEVGTATAATIVSSPAPRWQERAMPETWSGCAEAVRACLGAARVVPEAVLGVGVAGHGDGAYLVGSDLQPLRPAILATDSRAHAEAASLTPAQASRSLALTGQVPYPGAPTALLPWLAVHEPAILEQVRHALYCKDWIRLCLTGVAATDPTDASAAFWDVTRQEWSSEAFALCALEALADRTPAIVGSAATAGTVTAAAAAATGLAEGTPVAGGAHDVAAAALGIGSIGAGALSIVLGTFSINQVVASTPSIDRRWQAHAFLRPDAWLHMSTSPAGATNLEWALRRFPGGGRRARLRRCLRRRRREPRDDAARRRARLPPLPLRIAASGDARRGTRRRPRLALPGRRPARRGRGRRRQPSLALRGAR
jgi:L-xylulokinase